MFWRDGIPTILLAWMLLAAPAAAGIQRHTDSQGVIHISNNSPASSGQNRKESASSPTGAIDPVTLPASSEPHSAAAVEPSPQIQPPAAAVLQKSPQAANPVPVAEQNPAVHQGSATVPETGAEAGHLPVKKVAFSEAEPGPAAMTAPQAAIPRQSEVIKEGGIRRFRDQQGTLHITNVTPNREDSAPRQLQAPNRAGLGNNFPAETPGRGAAAAAGLPLQKVSWSPDHPESMVFPALAAAAGIREPAPADSVHCYRDSRGVIHINNSEPKAAAISHPLRVQARAGPEAERAPLPENGPPPGGGAAAPAAQQPGAPIGEGISGPPAALISAPFCGPETGLLGGIRRFRDRRGVWHLETAPAPGLPGPPRLPSLSELGQKLTLASLNPAVAPASVSGSAAALNRSLSAPGRNYGGIMVSRDHRGRLTITNSQPVVGVGKGPVMAEARALVEPIIQEASRNFALPATLIRAVIKVESNFATWAVSPKGAMGLMQLMPATAAFLGVQQPFDPRENIFGGCRYLRMLVDFFGGSLQLALAGYNAGYQRVVDCGYRVPDIKETQEFVTQIMGYYLAEEKKAQLPRI
ncbi:MAG: lytic transglycosylase domain-containing protein [Desulfobaccales bacterium]